MKINCVVCNRFVKEFKFYCVFRCEDCAAKQSREMNERMERARKEIGGRSCSREYELEVPPSSSSERKKGTCGGGRRVIRKADPFS